MNRKTTLMTIAFTAVLMGTIACSLISGLVDQGQGAISTAQSRQISRRLGETPQRTSRCRKSRWKIYLPPISW